MIYLINMCLYVHAKLLQSYVTLWTIACQTPPSMGFSRQESWSGLPFPPPVHESETWKWSRLVVSDSVRPHRQPIRLCCSWDSPGKNTGVGCHFLLQCMKVKSESEVTESCPTLVTPWTIAHQPSQFMGFSRQENWSGLPLPSPERILYLTKKKSF